MKTEKTTGRNAPCPCGSGLKFKACCAEKTAPAAEPRTSRYFLLGLVLLAAAAAFVLLSGRGSKGSDTAEKAPPRAALSTLPAQPTPGTLLPQAPIAQGPLTPQPPGAVPDGKVRSPEHGHWHDVQGSTPQMTPLDISQGSPTPAPTFTPGPQPPGPVPEGKVWSPEHGHWHDVAPVTPAPP